MTLIDAENTSIQPDHTNGTTTTTTTTTTTHVRELDALIVGAGFGGVYQLKRLRDQGYNVKLVESGTDYGGVWHWNRYPGARVDSPVPFYEFSDPELWADWVWKEKYPGSAELRSYFNYVADKWRLRPDTEFETSVSGAAWDDEAARWTVRTAGVGGVFRVKYLLLNTGFAAKKYIPDWPGVDSFQGTFLHPSIWPRSDPDFRGKRVAVIGTGPTGVQLAQELGKIAEHLTVFQRTPNMSIPMGQVRYEVPEQGFSKSDYPSLFRQRTDSVAGLDFNRVQRSTFDDSDEQRIKLYEELWAKGDFRFWLATYYDMLTAEDANHEAYKFWRDRTRPRIQDDRIAEMLAPMEQPHAFGCKRISLETDYFDMFNQSNVTLVDISSKGTPIEAITPEGIKTADREYGFDAIICATGYDSVTGGLTQIDIRGASGISLKERWKDGVATYLGLTVAGFPNMAFTYGPQAPTALCNGPTCAEMQGDWIINLMNHMRKEGLSKVEATSEREEEYKDQIWRLANLTMVPSVDSWWMGANIPGKRREPLIYLGGVPAYYQTLNEVAANNYDGFVLS